MKKIILVISILILAVTTISYGSGLTATLATYPINLNNQRLEAAPLNVNGSTYLPVRTVSEALGVDIGWTGSSVEIQTVDVEALKEACVMIYAASNGKVTMQGSGVYVDYSEVLTAQHVIDGADQYGTINKEFASVIDQDGELDAAILKSKEKIKPVKIGDSDEMKVGDKVIIIGAPEENEDTVSYATVKRHADEIVLNGMIGDGGSGSAVFDISGSLIGIAYMVDLNFNETYVTPINDIREAF
jgi:S1-C subfamily serine protease